MTYQYSYNELEQMPTAPHNTPVITNQTYPPYYDIPSIDQSNQPVSIPVQHIFYHPLPHNHQQNDDHCDHHNHNKKNHCKSLFECFKLICDNSICKFLVTILVLLIGFFIAQRIFKLF